MCLFGKRDFQNFVNISSSVSISKNLCKKTVCKIYFKLTLNLWLGTDRLRVFYVVCLIYVFKNEILSTAKWLCIVKFPDNLDYFLFPKHSLYLTLYFLLIELNKYKFLLWLFERYLCLSHCFLALLAKFILLLSDLLV